MTNRHALGGIAAAIVATGLGLFAMTALAASPTLTLTATDATIGGSIHATADLAASSNAGGQISFEVFGPDDTDCSGPALTPAPAAATVSGDGQYASGDFTPTEPGTYRWSASYPGDAENDPAEADCAATSVVAKAVPTLTGTATSAAVGQTITDSATLASAHQATGALTFSAFGPANPTCTGAAAYTAPVTVSGNGSYSPPGFAPAAQGQYRWRVEYGGDANNEPFTLGCGSANQSSTVSKASPTLTGTATNATIGGSIQMSAQLSASAAAGGQISFEVFGPGDTDCSGPALTPAPAAATVSGDGQYASGSFTPTTPGTYRWSAHYPGDADNDAADAECAASSVVAKASPTLTGIATSSTVGQTVTDTATLTGGHLATGTLTFSAFGPGNATCAGGAAYAVPVAVNGDGSYSPPGFAPPPGLYRWTVAYSGDANNEPFTLGCGSANQSSIVGSIAIPVTATASSTGIGGSLTVTATIGEGGVPAGQLTFRAFSPSDPACAAAPAFTSTVAVSGSGSYTSEVFTPAQVGTFHWTVSYSGDANHEPVMVACGGVSSAVAQAAPGISGRVKQRALVGAGFTDTVTLSAAYAPSGTVIFRIYGPNAAGCGQPDFVDTVEVGVSGIAHSDPFVATAPGRYVFVATYAGDAANRGVSEACGAEGQTALVLKRKPHLTPQARLIGGRRIAIRAKLSGAVSPSGSISFRLYRPGDGRCRRPAFRGRVTAARNGAMLLAKYLASRSGVYRLVVAYSGDPRNESLAADCAAAQRIQIR